MGRTTKEEQERDASERLQQAKAAKQKHKLQGAHHVTASCALLGNAYGVGIGLYFKVLSWLRWLLFWLALCMIPFMIVVNSSRFTTPEHKGVADGASMAVLPSFNILQSLTFAAMPDDEVDQGLLSWMNIQLPGFVGVFAMPRAFFLVWISLMDAGSMAVFSLACLVLYKLAARFSKAVDKATMEVADYTLVVKGLPETTPIDIGHHFSRFGRVMDVVMVKDFGPLLKLAETATNLEQQRKAAENTRAHGRKAAKRQQRIKKMEKKMGSFMEQANQRLEGSGFDLKAVFVTFDKESQVDACMAACPRGWAGSWFQRRRERFLGKYRFWVEPAKPPEDFIYENLSVSRLSRYIRMAIVRLVVFCILLATAAAVTKLMSLNMDAARSIVWQNDAMDGMIKMDMRFYPLGAGDAVLAPTAANATLAHIADAVGDDAAQRLAAEYYQEVSYCSVNLATTCSAGFSKLLGAQVLMRAAEGATWSNLTDSLVKREAFLTQLPACSKPSSGCTSLAMCYPCHCSMLSLVAAARAADRDWVLAMRQECGGFIETLDMHAYVMKGLISGVIVLLNFVLKSILQWLVVFEKHWTASDKERAYAVLAFVSQLLNSVLVLLLVNAQSSIASAAINGALSSGTASKYTSWGTNLILSGAYSDFSPSWYVDVGQSLQLLIIINAAVTAAFTVGMWLLRKARQCLLLTFLKGSSQSAWNAAWIGMEFVLDARVSDIMLGMWIILMFGSGIPSLYAWGLIWLGVVELTDRWSLARVCQVPARYGKSLPFLLLGVLPWAAATHCAFGLWMHTRFNAGHVGGEQISGLASSAGARAQALYETYYFTRITQANGLPLLVLLIVHLAAHTFIRFMIYFFGKAFMAMCGCCKDDTSTDPQDEVTYEAALLARHAQTTQAAAYCAAGGGGGGAGTNNLGSRAHSVSARPGVALAGAPTYRLPHHPRYSEIFSNPLYKPVWFKAFGRLRYTTLLSRPGGGFIIAPEPILDHDQSDMEQSLSSMSSDLQRMALKMADDTGLEGSGKRKRHSGLLTDELQAMRERSMSVQVAVLAGIGVDSPRASFSGPTGMRPGSLTAPASPAAAGAAAASRASFTLAGAAGTASAAAATGVAAAAASGGSFSMLSPGPNAGRPRFSCAADEKHAAAAYAAAAVAAGVAGAAAADPRGESQLLYGDGEQAGAAAADQTPTEDVQQQQQQQYWQGASGQHQAWTVGVDGTPMPLLPVLLPGGGCAYYPADSLPAGAVVASPAQLDAAAAAAAAAVSAGAASGGPAQDSVTLSGGLGSGGVDIQLQPQLPTQELQWWQQQQHQQAGVTEAADAAAAQSEAQAGAESLRQAARLQDRAEAIFGQPLSVAPAEPAAAGPPGSSNVDDSSGAFFHWGLPMPPAGAAGSCDDAAGPAAAAAVDSGAGAAAAAAAAAAPASGPVQAEPGWMCDGLMPCAAAAAAAAGGGFSLWDGVLAAAGHQAPAPGSPQHLPAPEMVQQQQQQQPAGTWYQDINAATTPRAAAAAAVDLGGPAFYYPAIHLSCAEPPPAYPNVHLTTVEMPAGFGAPTAAAAAAGPCGAFSSALLASTRAVQGGSSYSPFKDDAEQPQQPQQEVYMQPPWQPAMSSMPAPWTAAGPAVASEAAGVSDGAAAAGVVAPVGAPLSAEADAELVMLADAAAMHLEAAAAAAAAATAAATAASGPAAAVPGDAADASTMPGPTAGAAGTGSEQQQQQQQQQEEATLPGPDGSSSEGSSDAECSTPRHQAAGAAATAGGKKKKRHRKGKKARKGKKG